MKANKAFFGIRGGLRAQAAIESSCGTTARLLHAQAAMEYLMTYGWALLIIFIVIAVLVVINPLSTPATCRFDQVGFGCPVLPALDTAGNLYMRVVNSNNNDIVIIQTLCTENKTTVPPTWPGASIPSVTVKRQETFDVKTGISGGTVCYSSDGTHIFSQGEEFTGKLWILYRNSEDPASYPYRTVSATIATKVG